MDGPRGKERVADSNFAELSVTNASGVERFRREARLDVYFLSRHANRIYVSLHETVRDTDKSDTAVSLNLGSRFHSARTERPDRAES